MKRNLMLTICALLFVVCVQAQPPVPPPAPPVPPPAPAITGKEFENKMQELESQMKALEEQMQELRLHYMIPDSMRKKTIIINGERVDEFNDSIMEDAFRRMEGFNFNGDSISFRMFQNKDSLVIDMGNMKFRVFDDKDEHDLLPYPPPAPEEPVVVPNEEDKGNFDVKWFGFRLGINNYMHKGKFKNAPGYEDLELIPGKSINVGIGIFDAQLDLIKDHLVLHGILGLDISNYRFSGDNMLLHTVDTVGFRTPGGEEKVTKNKLVTTYVVIPVRLQYESNKNYNKSFRISAGARAGYLLGAHTKFIVNDDKIKHYDNFNLSTFKYGLEFTIGYSWLNFYVDYDLSPFFSSGVNPELTPISAGIALGNF